MSWWYGNGWKQVVNSFSSRVNSIEDLFSVHQLIRTLFAPWRRIITYPGATLEDKFRAWGDNLFSRSIGFIVRFIVLFFASLIIFIVLVITLIELLIWPLIPPSIIGFLIVGALL